MNGDSFSIRKFTEFARFRRTGSRFGGLFAQVEPAELVDVFQLAEFEVCPKVEDEVFFLGGGDMDRVIKGLDGIDV